MEVSGVKHERAREVRGHSYMGFRVRDPGKFARGFRAFSSVCWGVSCLVFIAIGHPFVLFSALSTLSRRF